MRRVLIITTNSAYTGNFPALRTFTTALNKGEDSFEYAPIQQLLFEIKQGLVSITYQGKEIHDNYDVIHLRNHDKYPDFANGLRTYCEAHDVYVVNRADSCLPYFGKLSQGICFALNNIPTPDLIIALGNAELLQAVKDSGWKYPLILKHNEGVRGADNYLVKDVKQLEKILAQDKHGFVAQPFVKNDGELRVLTFGDTLPPLIFQKTAATGTHLNNTSQGGSAQLLNAEDVSSDILNTALRAAKVTGRDIAGVDVLLASDGSYYVLEVNSTPAIASGVYLNEKQELYAKYFASLKGNA